MVTKWPYPIYSTFRNKQNKGQEHSEQCLKISGSIFYYSWRLSAFSVFIQSCIENTRFKHTGRIFQLHLILSKHAVVVVVYFPISFNLSISREPSGWIYISARPTDEVVLRRQRHGDEIKEQREGDRVQAKRKWPAGGFVFQLRPRDLRAMWGRRCTTDGRTRSL